MRNVIVIFKKQLRYTLKNKSVLIQFILFPIMTIIMENMVKMDGMPEHYFTLMFSAMYMGMAPITAASAIIAEEKEMNTLRVLMMAKVTPVQYLLGIGSYVFIFCMLGGVVMGVASGIAGMQLVTFIASMALGFIISTLLGAALGIQARNQMAATSTSVPVVMILSFLPLIGMFNSAIAGIAELTYTQQMSNVINSLSFGALDTKGIIVIAVNAAIFIGFFIYIYKKKGLE